MALYRLTDEQRSQYPKPDAGQITELTEWLSNDWQRYLDAVETHRSNRYHNDTTNEKEARHLKSTGRFYSNTSNREIVDTVAIQTGNPPRFKIEAAGATKKAKDRADKQTRWSNALFEAFERQSGRKGLRRRFIDNQHSCGLGVYEFYLKSGTVYDHIDRLLESEMQYDEETGEEDPKATAEAVDEKLRGVLPFGLRVIDPLSVRWEEDDEGICRAVIIEEKPRRLVFEERIKRQKEKAPEEGIPGWPEHQAREGTNDVVKTIRYYDRVYMGYIVDGEAEYIEPHGLPGVPIFYATSILTGSPNRSEAWQGVTWGIDELVTYLDDMLTQAIDDAKRYRPRPVVTTPEKGVPAQGEGNKPQVLRLSDPDEILQLGPGQQVADLWSGVRPDNLEPMIELTISLIQRSSLNPIATGTSIGADPAGYTVNTLISASQKRYECALDSEAVCNGEVNDFARLTIRDAIKEKVYQSVPMADTEKGGTEWLGLGPDDIDETPSVCTIDAIGDQNRIATRQSLMQARESGVISTERVQQEGFGIDDARLENFQIAREQMQQQMPPFAFQEALRRVYGARSPLGGAQAQQQPGVAPTNGVGGGGVPAQTQAPSVGGALSAASQLGGQGNGVTAQAGVTT